ncbi:hypothetical protein UCRPC4_g04594 [Phaeomoniella chlamydospora]|uniref:C2H2-type domain-containing protein n=1 Tax=Phaeomoniella chlamydospora TaxID=158046 RepID=A0A0G2GQX4_PHACM|nr:hypothetical protein UCRPC4_g04594 [Phaeomoniella chlamydospora]
MPPRFCELQVLRFRKVHLKVLYPTGLHGEGQREELDAIKRRIEELAAALSKSNAIKVVQLTIQTQHYFPDHHSWPQFSLIEPEGKIETYMVFLPLITVAAERAFRLSIQPRTVINPRWSPRQKSDETDPDDINEWIPTFMCDWDPIAVLVAMRYSHAVESMKLKSPTSTTSPSCGYALIPECRTCYRVFETKQKLSEHIMASRHQMEYQHKTQNVLWPDKRKAQRPGYICFFCGTGFETRGSLDKHIDKFRHGRDSMISRWVHCDWEFVENAIRQKPRWLVKKEQRDAADKEAERALYRCEFGCFTDSSMEEINPLPLTTYAGVEYR